MKKCFVNLLVSAIVTFVGSVSDSCQAETLNPKSYDLLNGQLGGDVPNFFDDTYTGTGNKHAVLAPLTGGLGDLTDGVIATTNWNGQYLRYVGWASIDPKITFHFQNQVSLDDVRFYFDDAEFGGVENPAGVTISNGTTSLFAPVSDPPGNAPFVFDFNTHGLSGTDFDVTLHRTFVNGGNRWVMVSEVQFTGTEGTASVPEPSSMAILATGLVSTALVRLRRKIWNSRSILS